MADSYYLIGALASSAKENLCSMAPKKKKPVRKKSSIAMPAFEYNPPNVYELGVKPYLFVKCK